MGIEFEVRRVSPDDAAQLQQSCWANWPVEVVSEALERVEILAQQGRGFAVVACQGERILGYGQMTVWPRAAEISDLIVAPPYRDNGIGTALIGYLVDKVRTWHLPCVEIGAALSNPRALALYRRLGFKDARTIELDLGSGPETVVYLNLDIDYESAPQNVGLPPKSERN
jgi:ribosomal protein S18 acetylase RimI-like enzyme